MVNPTLSIIGYVILRLPIRTRARLRLLSYEIKAGGGEELARARAFTQILRHNSIKDLFAELLIVKYVKM